MSSVNFKKPSSSTAVSHSNNSYTIVNEGSVKKNLAFSRDTSERFLYVNYPETIINTSKCFANNDGGNKYILQTTIAANETVQLFFSHHNRSGKAINYGILIYNPSTSSSVEVSAPNIGFSSGWNHAEFSPWVDFYTGPSTSVTVPARQSKFLVDWRNISSDTSGGEPFSGIMRITSPKQVILTVYMWYGNDTTVIDGNERQYEYNINESGNNYDKEPAKKYTGIGAGYYLTVSNTVKYSDVSGNGIYYPLAHCNIGNTNEMIPISIAGTSYVAKEGATNNKLTNLGNWGAQYQFTTTLDNRGNNSSKTFKCYIGRNSNEGKVVVKYRNSIEYCSMGESTSTLGKAYKYNCFDVTVDANSTKTITFQLHHATCSSSPIYIQWK